jgi:trehalose-6-phosphate synthase
MVTPLRDGMNLVAKEYVAAQDPEDPGVLILSRFAGAAEEMASALIVNPYDISATADVIRVALEMSLAERRERHRALLENVEKNDIGAWCRSFIAALEQVAWAGDAISGREPEAITRALENLRKQTKSSGKSRTSTAKVVESSGTTRIN